MGPLAVVGFHMLDMACIPKSKTLSICAFIFVLLSLTLHNACSLLKKTSNTLCLSAYALCSVGLFPVLTHVQCFYWD